MGDQPFVRQGGGMRRADDTVRATRRGATVIVRPALAASVLPLNVLARDSYCMREAALGVIAGLSLGESVLLLSFGYHQAMFEGTGPNFEGGTERCWQKT
ncbi:uncharacterized protein SCHCODRAFT_02672687 [Schizophyllum commune H4-8]|uniref:Expressed protein n=1 Tax=Schizophyllum commune (strain H4-8 / FGSC 9210) TaxID=578458 RepID=D8QJ47_SCHCM|nr:uncharacterized protein SCHCODRAFT_02672687 [Schizophyllum commune H4-8]KAI5886489.1 hypothetical protein SCHCODRAFT_02672687 [Schizophyllum commune H4-8]